MIKLYELWDIFFSRLLTTLPYFWLRWRVKRCQVHSIQETVLRKILFLMAESAYLKKYGVSPSDSVQVFQSKTPVVKYQDIEPFLNKVYEGESNTLYRDGIAPKGFALTSGTTGKRKLIPLTDASFSAIKDSFWFLGVGLLYQNPGNQLFGVLNLASSSELSTSPAGVPCGEITGMIANRQSFILRSHYALPTAVQEINDVQLKYYLILRIALCNKHLRMMMTATPSTLIALSKFLEAEADDLIADIENGTFKYKDEIPKHLLSELKHYIEYSSAPRSRQLKDILKKHGRLLPRDVWPELQTIVTWLSGSFHHYKEELQRIFNPIHLRDTGLSASEGHFTLPVHNDSDSCILNVWNYFFEFIDLDSHEILLPEQLIEGKSYRLVVSTPGGLLRYDTQDLVKIVGWQSQIPLIEFQAKDSDFLDLTGEKLSADIVSKIIKELGSQHSVTRFLVSPNSQRNGFIFYFISEVPNDFDLKIDAKLKEMNECYSEHRTIGKLHSPEVRVISQEKLKEVEYLIKKNRGGSLEQFKPPLFIKDPL